MTKITVSSTFEKTVDNTKLLAYDPPFFPEIEEDNSDNWDDDYYDDEEYYEDFEEDTPIFYDDEE